MHTREIKWIDSHVLRAKLFLYVCLSGWRCTKYQKRKYFCTYYKQNILISWQRENPMTGFSITKKKTNRRNWIVFAYITQLCFSI